MSLRDQLLKAGLVDKKQVQKTNRKLKKNRRKEQSQRERKTTLESREAEQRAHEAAQIQQARRTRRRASEEARDHDNLSRLVGNLVRSYGLSVPEGRHGFYHKMPDGRRLQRLQIPLETAMALRAGTLAIGWTGSEEEPDIVLLPATAARRIWSHEPSRILFFKPEPPERSDPSDRLAGLENLPAQRDR